MDQREPRLPFEIKDLLFRIQTAQQSFAKVCAESNALVQQYYAQLQQNAPSIHVAEIEPMPRPNQVTPCEPNQRVEPAQDFRGEMGDHYVGLPFMDPYECFDDSAPLASFPAPELQRRIGALEGLFQIDPWSQQRRRGS